MPDNKAPEDVEAEVVLDTGDDIEEGDSIEEGDVAVDAGDTTVVVAAPEPAGDAVDAVVVGTAIDQAGQIAALGVRVSILEGQVAALELAQVVEEVAEEEVEPVIEIVTDDDDDAAEDSDEFPGDLPEPKSAKAHPLFRSRKDWFDK